MKYQTTIDGLQFQIQHNLDIAESNYERKHYDFALFLGHLVLEKTIKRIILIKTDTMYPPMHDLVKLCELANINLSKIQTTEFTQITKYNISGRYDDEKNEFYHLATKDYTDIWFNKIKQYKLWLEQHI